MDTRSPSRRLSAGKKFGEKKMSVVCFIGAGFTKAIADSAPVGNDFLAKAFRPEWGFFSNPDVAELRRFLESTYHPLREESDFPRVEDVLSILDFCIRRGRGLNKDFDYDRLVHLRGTLIYLIGRMIQTCFYRPEARPELARTFVREIHKIIHQYNFTVISTNYDIVLDNSLLSQAESCNYGIKLRANILLPGSPNIRPVLPFPNEPERWHYADPFGAGDEGGGHLNHGEIQYLKVHGSLNWVYCRRCDEIDITIAQKRASNLLEGGEDRLCVNPYCTCSYEPFLGYPTMLKSYESRLLSELWMLSETALASARKIIFIGYSLPEADYLIRALLIRGLSQNEAKETLCIIVIDKETKSDEDKDCLSQLTGRYVSLLGDRADVRSIGLEGLLNDFGSIVAS